MSLIGRFLQALDFFDLRESLLKLALVEDRLDFHDRGDRVGRDNLVGAVVFVYGAGLLVIDDDVLMIAHLVVRVDHEALRRVEALRQMTVQKPSYLFLGFTPLFPGMGDGFSYVFEVVAKLFSGGGNQPCNCAFF